jgi:hypothetical protein
MLGLNLRKEFQGHRLKGTAIELSNDNHTGATQVPAGEFLEITYPSGDLLKAIEAVGPGQSRPVVLIGERGQGKSHLMAALYHALTDAAQTKQWLDTWAGRLNNQKLGQLPLRSGMIVISESLHKQRFKYLWNLLFERHPHGNYVRGKWEGLGGQKTDVPPHHLLLELFQQQPVALILDEFQTWYDGLTNTSAHPQKAWAFNFIQILSEIAKEHPELLTLVVSVRNGSTDAFQQIHRVSPVLVDFKGPTAAHDRRRLLLHRLFENRLQVHQTDVEQLIETHVSESFRLLDVPQTDQEQKKQEFMESWPFAPGLMQLLEDQVLVATQAQETRDLIRILAYLYKTRGEQTPIITAADFLMEDEKSVITALLDSVANQHHANLREKAQRNLKAVVEATANAKQTVPHLSEVVGALWLRSLAVGNQAGANQPTLQVDITKEKAIDDNAFQVEMATIVDNSFNIHPVGDRLVFKEEENPRAKLMAYARNDKLFTDGSDRAYLARELRYVIGGSDDVARLFKVIVLPRNWETDPWGEVEESERPDKWDERLPILVLPEEPQRLDETLGNWLKTNLQRRRNTIRYLLPRAGSTALYQDRDLLITARAIIKAQEWRTENVEYGKLHTKFQGELRGILKQRFDRYAILRVWNYADPARCRFHLEPVGAQGAQIPEKIDESVRNDLFIPEEFEVVVIEATQQGRPIGKLMNELQEPRPNEQDSIPWLGETAIKEKIIRLCARGKIAVNLRGTEYLQARPGEGEEAAWARMKSKLGTGRHLEESLLLFPQAVPQAHGVGQIAAAGGGTAPVQPLGGLFEQSGAQVTPPGGQGQVTPDGVGGTTAPPPIFGGDSGAAILTPLHAPPTSPLNLIGKVEGWGIGPGASLRELSIKVGSLTGAQLQKLLRALPDGMTYELECKKEEG